jgi:hypothetical protein
MPAVAADIFACDSALIRLTASLNAPAGTPASARRSSRNRCAGWAPAQVAAAIHRHLVPELHHFRAQLRRQRFDIDRRRLATSPRQAPVAAPGSDARPRPARPARPQSGETPPVAWLVEQRAPSPSASAASSACHAGAIDRAQHGRRRAARRELPAGVGDGLVEQRQAIAQAAVGGLGQLADRRRHRPRCLRPQDLAICPRSAPSSSRFRLNCRQRDSTVTGSFCGSVVASRNLTCSGGSSSVFSSALNAASTACALRRSGRPCTCRATACTARSRSARARRPRRCWRRRRSPAGRCSGRRRCRRQVAHSPHGSALVPCSQFSDLAKMRAMVVLPTPRVPVNRKAWWTRPVSSALVSARTTCSCPTSSAKRLGRHLRARTR